MICPNCKTTVRPGLSFCEKCGMKVSGVVTDRAGALKNMLKGPLFITTLISVIIYLIVSVALWYGDFSDALFEGADVLNDILGGGTGGEEIRLYSMLIVCLPIFLIALGTLLLTVCGSGKSIITGCGFIKAGAVIYIIYYCILLALNVYYLYAFEKFASDLNVEMDTLRITLLVMIAVLCLIIWYYVSFVQAAGALHFALVGGHSNRKPSVYLAVMNIISAVLNLILAFIVFVAMNADDGTIAGNTIMLLLVQTVVKIVVLILFTVIIFKTRDIFYDRTLTMISDVGSYGIDDSFEEERRSEYSDDYGSGSFGYDDSPEFESREFYEDDPNERTVSIAHGEQCDFCLKCGKPLYNGEKCSCLSGESSVIYRADEPVHRSGDSEYGEERRDLIAKGDSGLKNTMGKPKNISSEELGRINAGKNFFGKPGNLDL